MPVAARAGQAGHLHAEHDADVAQADLGHQALEAQASLGGCRRVAPGPRRSPECAPAATPRLSRDRPGRTASGSTPGDARPAGVSIAECRRPPGDHDARGGSCRGVQRSAGSWATSLDPVRWGSARQRRISRPRWIITLRCCDSRQLRPRHSVRPKVHGHGAAPANGPRLARPRGPLSDTKSTGLTTQRFLR